MTNNMNKSPGLRLDPPNTPHHQANIRAKKRKHNSALRTEPPSTPPPSDSDAGAQISPSKHIKRETSKSPSNNQKLKPPAVDLTYDTIVKVFIGSEALREFGIHKGLLCKASSLFRTALFEGESDTTDIIVDPDQQALLLPNEDVSVFTRVNRWLFTESFLLEGETIQDLTWTDLISIYLFATKMKITRLQNRCIDVTILKSSTPSSVFPNVDNMNRLWRLDTNASQLRRLFIELYASKADLNKAMALPGNFHPGFMKGLVLELYALNSAKKEGKAYKVIKFWKKREGYYVSDETNPVVVE